MQSNDRLKNRVSNFQTKASKRPFENTANYQNSMKQNRMDPRTFSVYKILEDPRGIVDDFTRYVDIDYVEDYYIQIVDKFNPIQ